MVKYPLRFEVTASAESGISRVWSSRAGDRDPVPIAIPPEFEGPGGGFSPEDLYALALMNCFAATFKVIAERSRVEYRGLSLSGALTVDRDESGAPWMKRFELSVLLEGVADPERADRVLKKTSASCLILNSVKTEIAFDFKVAS